MTTQPAGNDVSAAIELARTAANDALTAAARTGPGTGLVPTGPDAAVAVKAQMASQRAVIAKAQKHALAAQDAAKEIIKAKQAELDAEMRAMAKMLEPLLAQVQLLNEGIWTINLYLGRDEEIHTLTEGDPAPAGTPIHIRQQVLAMDEETAVDAATGGMDVRSIAQFDQWVTADPAHLHQVLPEQRGVVAIMPRRTDRDYGDPWANEALNAANKQTWWLIRNGDNLYRMLTDFKVGPRLVPSRNEFTSMFLDRWTKEPLQPGTDAWMKAEKAAGQRERHFMRIALILQGLVDRTAVFHPLPVAGLSLLAPAHYDDGHVVLIADDENQITTGRKPFSQWLAGKNRQLTPGMRVIVNTQHSSWPDRVRDGYGSGGHPRLHPPRAEAPSSTAVHTITKRTGGGDLSFTYPRTVKEWIGSGYDAEYRVPTTPASCTLATDDQFVLPIDLVTVTEMRDYLAARTERHAYEQMFPTLTAAIAFKEAETAQEAPFRALLAAQIAAADTITVAEAAQFVDELVTWWKVGNRWNRALNGAPEAEVKAARMILLEHAARVRTTDTSDQAAQTLTALRAANPNALFVARKKDGTWVVGTASARRWVAPTDKESNGHGAQVAPLNVFVDLAEYTPTGKPRTVKAWQVPEPAVIARWTMLHTAPAWESWNRRARRAEHLSDPEIETAIDTIWSWPAPTDCGLMAITYDEQGTYRSDPPRFEVWYHPNAGAGTSDRALTGELAYVKSLTQNVTWSRVCGAVMLHAGHRPSSGTNHGTWTPAHNWLLQPEKVGQYQAPFVSGNRRHQVVHLDEAVLAAAFVQVGAWDGARRARAELSAQARTLTAGIEDAWKDHAIAAAKVRFMEDYADESLWEDHAKTLSVKVPWLGTPAKGYERVDGGLHWLTARLVETGRPPHGLSVAEALAVLAEPVVDRPEFGHSSGREVTFPGAVLGLRYPDLPVNAGQLAAM